MHVPFLDLAAQTAAIRDEVLAAITRVVDSQKFILGDEVRQFEQQAAEYCGARFAVGCASGSDALLLALKAACAGAGDAVLTVPFTFFATAGAVALAGARPVFVDVDRDTFNIDVSQIEPALKRYPNIKAILPVHLFGGCADMDPIREIARSRKIAVIEDAAQAIGAEYKGRRAGSLGDIGCFSFYPTKNLGAFGDGGLCTTNDEALAGRLRALRVHGRTATYFHERIGFASRLDAIQAAVLAVKLKYLDQWSDRRASNAALYLRLFDEHQSSVIPPRPAPYQTRHIFHQFVVRCPRDRDEVQMRLRSEGVASEVYYPLALHEQPCFADLGYKRGDFPVSEELARTVLALPVHPDLSESQIRHAATTLTRLLP
ncbi:MAG TPA: DegT/DnrJ/EryC1/StrS family aminotransferase [Bryobacteraceae bacterium]|jgi:dTDP-4-amino-4,6-dideoxygalactose transaminase|nr:DegT/DnrJ/EryC1/StrS family aminotransferase [Bryobacteraceae bacterium]